MQSRRMIGAALGVLALGAHWAAAQQSAALDEIRTLANDFARVDQVVSVAEAERVRERLAALKLNPADLKPREQEQLLRVELFAALGTGQAAAAASAADQLALLAPKKRLPLESAYVAALVNCHAARADERLRELLGTAAGAEKEQLSRRQRWLRTIGSEAPEVVIEAGDERFSASDRRKRVLLIDFWSVLNTPGDLHVSTLLSVHEEFKGTAAFQMVGVNTDAESRVERARAFATEKGWVWPQHFERMAAGAPITHKAFRAGPAPYQVLIDGRGIIRAVGSAADPAFRYAIRAAVAETLGKASAPQPIDVAGKTPAEFAPPPPPEAPPPTHNEPPRASDPAAADLLRQARVFLKTGRKTDARAMLQRIVSEYPKSLEAREAADLLINL
ncbi:MAG: tetratricopeptide repeat protein [Phycisphaerales bacterium]|nr:tetratricopeptide repeat protein [Phycisphaerales bacterium]